MFTPHVHSVGRLPTAHPAPEAQRRSPLPSRVGAETPARLDSFASSAPAAPIAAAPASTEPRLRYVA